MLLKITYYYGNKDDCLAILKFNSRQKKKDNIFHEILIIDSYSTFQSLRTGQEIYVFEKKIIISCLLPLQNQLIICLRCLLQKHHLLLPWFLLL